jgi:nucleoside-diphosphate-sugar epimerase
MESDVTDVINIGSDEMISINDLAEMALDIAGINAKVVNVDGPVGVMGRCSDNRLIAEKLGWAPSEPLLEGMKKTMRWIEKEFLASYNKP